MVMRCWARKGSAGATGVVALVAALTLLLAACGPFEDEGAVQPPPTRIAATHAASPGPRSSDEGAAQPPPTSTVPVTAANGCPGNGVGRADGPRSAEPPPTSSYEVVASYPHDPAAFTQGLVWHEGGLYESTGLYGESSLRQVDLVTGEVLRSVAVPAEHFAEGLAILDGRAIQLTWRSQIGFVYDLQRFGRQGQFAYEGEGWGLTHDGRSLIMSDGTHRIRFLDPATFATTRCIGVYDGARPLANLNELEYVRGEIWANVWQTERIVRIDPASGAILGWVDLSGLLPAGERTPSVDVLNGIAYDAAADRLFVTGKYWPRLFEIRLR